VVRISLPVKFISSCAVSLLQLLQQYYWESLQGCSLPHLYSTIILGCSRCTRSPVWGSASA